jgi:outer membrane protein, heavy metal efflux system
MRAARMWLCSTAFGAVTLAMGGTIPAALAQDPPKADPLKKAEIDRILQDAKAKKYPPLEYKLPNIPAGPKDPPIVYGTPPSQTTGPLPLAEVLRSVEAHYPLLRIAEQERGVAGGRVLSAMGAFDTNLSLASLNVPEGTFQNYRFNAGATQNFTSTGARLFSTYRGGYGDFPGYNGGLKTADGGEFSAGVLYPILRDGPIDRARANLQQASINRDAVEPFIERQRLDFHRAAGRVYWSWVATGHRLKSIRMIAGLALTRDGQIKQLLAGQQIPEIDRADNLRNLYSRNALLVDAQRAFMQASIDLSLFLRNDSGGQVLASLDRLPEFPSLQEPDSDQLGQAVQFALERRPEPRRLTLEIQALQVELRWAQNQRQPAVNAIISGNSDVGRGKPSSGPSRLDRNGLQVGFEFQAPAQFSDARGRIETATMQIAQRGQALRFQEDQIRTEVQNTFVALERAYQQVEIATEGARLANLVAEGERRFFAGGFGDMIRVNIREQQQFEAELILIGAKLDYFRSMAEYKAALGVTE